LRKAGVVLALAGICALSVFLVNCGSSSSRSTGLLYVLSEAASTVSSFAIDLGNGNLGLISDKPSTCAGSNCGLPLNISLDSTGKTALVLNQGPPATISGYTVNSDGSLSSPSVAATLGNTAVAMTRDTSGQFVFVVDEGNGSPTDCATTADADCPLLWVFTTQSGSTTLTPASIHQLSRIPSSISAITFTPQTGSQKTLVFVTNIQDLSQPPVDNTLSVFSIDSSGNVAESKFSPYSTQVNPTVVQAVNTNPVGQNTGGLFVYIGNQGASAGGMSTMQLCVTVDSDCSQDQVDNNLLKPIGTLLSLGQKPVATLVDPTNNFLYVACNTSNQVFAYRITTGTGILSGLTPPSQPTGAQPVSLAMRAGTNSANGFLYVADSGANGITGFTVGAKTGILSNSIAIVFVPGAPSGMAAK